MDLSFSCSGCNATFSKARYRRSHLTQTTNPACIAIRNSDFDSDGKLPPHPQPQPPSTTPTHPIPPQNRHNFGTIEGLHTTPDSDQNSDGNTGGEDEYNTQNEDAGASHEEHRRSPTPEFVFLPEEPQVESVKVCFPGRRAGEVLVEGIPTMKVYENNLGGPTPNPYSPFNSEIDWELAKWARLRGPSATSFTELLQINGLHKQLDLSYANSKEMNSKIDGLPGQCPKFRRSEVTVDGETSEYFHRDILACIAEIYGRHDLAPYLKFKPERHYADPNMTIRIYGDIHTGKWWWEVQTAVEKNTPGATIIPIFISTDETLVTSFCGKKVYPVYVTIGNLPKEIRRKPSTNTHVLLGYLPATDLKHMDSNTSRRRAVNNLFHKCMCQILKPLESSGKTGVKMRSGDGRVRRCHPILAVYAADHPEQCLVTCTKASECPKGMVAANSLGENSRCYLRDARDIIEAMEAFDPGKEPRGYAEMCKGAGIKPTVDPFWKFLPYANIYQSITPDILHQLHQGVIKHLLSWLQDAFGAHELDSRSRCLPPNHNVRHFSKGISNFSRISGTEHAEICKVILGLIIGLPLPNGLSSARLLSATRGLLDFLYLAQLPVHNDETLEQMGTALDNFHADKSIFVDLKIRSHFNFPKLHSLLHYAASIKLFGTTDNYNTEYSERLHIDMAKDAYAATNHKDELAQMTLWLERNEKVKRFNGLVSWRLLGRPRPPTDIPPTIHRAQIQVTRQPTRSATVDQICQDYGAVNFHAALSTFLSSHTNPQTSQPELWCGSPSPTFSSHRFPVFHKIKLWIPDPHGRSEAEDIHDVVHARSHTTTRAKRRLAARFDTALVNVSADDGPGDRCGVNGYRVAQVKMVFKLPQHDPRFESLRSKHLAYIEWFSPFRGAPEPYHGLYQISRSTQRAHREAAVVEVSRICQSVQLFPCFSGSWRVDWAPDNVLEKCDTFLVNSLLTRQSYLTVY